MEKLINKRDDFVVYVLFSFEPVQRFEYRGDMFTFGVPVTAATFYLNTGMPNMVFMRSFHFKL